MCAFAVQSCVIGSTMPPDGTAGGAEGDNFMIERSLSCTVLGAVRVEAHGQVVKIAAPRQRALLALLLLDPNRTVSASTLIDGIWGETPPQHPESALHIVVCRLRHALGIV